jgi:uncharacterized membrane protein YkoI
MKSWGKLLAAALVAAACPVTAMAQEHEQNQEHAEHEMPTSLDKVPAPVKDTMLKQAAGAPIIDVVQEHEGGTVVYEAHVRRNGQLIGIEVDPSGKLLRNEVEGQEKGDHKQQQQQQQPPPSE